MKRSRRPIARTKPMAHIDLYEMINPALCCAALARATQTSGTNKNQVPCSLRNTGNRFQVTGNQTLSGYPFSFISIPIPEIPRRSSIVWSKAIVVVVREKFIRFVLNHIVIKDLFPEVIKKPC